jgi:K+ transport systems, NAD-binding component
MARKSTDPNLFGVIGLGRFGSAVARQLVKEGKTVIAIDNDPQQLEPLKDVVDQLYPVSQINKAAFEEAGIDECETVIVGIGRDIENNLLAALAAIELGVKRVIAKASSNDHARLLQLIGAEVIFPEVDMGVRLAKSLRNRTTIDFLSLCEDFSIVEVEVGEVFDGRTVIDIDIRKKYSCNIIAIIRGNNVITNIHPETEIKQGDMLVISGADEDLAAFQKANSK